MNLHDTGPSVRIRLLARSRLLFLAALAALSLALPSCALRPRGEDEERERAEHAGAAWTADRAEDLEEGAGPARIPPVLPEDPTREDILRHAFLSNADLEARYWEWRSALEQVPQDSSFPAVAVPFSYMFGGGGTRIWDRTTLGISNDPMSNIPFPTKLATAGRRALEAARAAGLRFEAAKFALQARVLGLHADLALLAESLRIAEESVSILEIAVAQAAARVESGREGVQAILAARTELDLARNDLETLRSREPALRARMNAVLGREAEAPLPLPREIPPLRPVAATDAEWLALAAERSPELAALERAERAGEETESLAYQAWIPDFGLSAGFTGSMAQTLGAMAVLPTRIEAIRAGIEQAKANLRTARAVRIQYARDLAASFVINLATLRNDDRQSALFEDVIIPRATQLVEVAQTSYASGRSGYLELIQAQRTLLEARLSLAELRVEREKALLAIETVSAIDAEALAPGNRRGARAVRGSGMGMP